MSGPEQEKRSQQKQHGSLRTEVSVYEQLGGRVGFHSQERKPEWRNNILPLWCFLSLQAGVAYETGILLFRLLWIISNPSTGLLAHICLQHGLIPTQRLETNSHMVSGRAMKKILHAVRVYLCSSKPGHSSFPGGWDGKVSARNVGDLGSIPGLGRSPGEGNSNPLAYSCLEKPMDRGAW